MPKYENGSRLLGKVPRDERPACFKPVLPPAAGRLHPDLFGFMPSDSVGILQTRKHVLKVVFWWREDERERKRASIRITLLL